MTFDPRSILFVPGDRPERFAKALASPADAICIDLEDAVAPEAKASARASALDFLKTSPEAARTVLRLNALSTAAGMVDAAALLEAGVAPAALMTPKAESADVLASLHAAFAGQGGPQPLIALVESAAGLAHAGDLARAPGVVALALGPIDLAAQLGAQFDEQALSTIRLQIRLGASRGGVMAWDGPSLAIDDLAQLSADARSAAALGFSGKLCIHPAQVAAINAGFSPSAASIDWARRVIAAAKSGKGAVTVDGKMVDRPVVLHAEKILALAGGNCSGALTPRRAIQTIA